MHTLTASDGVELAYRTFGTGSTNVVLVHGWMMSGAVYDDLLAAAGDDGVRWIVPDLRGAGRSGSADGTYTIEQYAKDVIAVADAAGAATFVVVGHSMGGQIAQLIAATWPDRVIGAALLCPVPASGMALPDEARGLFFTSGQNREMQKTILGLACKQLPEAARERMLDDAAKITPECIQGAFTAWTSASFVDKLGAIRAPVLVLGTDDPFLPQDFLRAAVVSNIKRASLVYLPGPGHYPGSESPRETAAILRAFLTPLLQG
jgi:pimeloyl-ACP methyl ester carboxylesterase